jgi:hypothetical protein
LTIEGNINFFSKYWDIISLFTSKENQILKKIKTNFENKKFIELDDEISQENGEDNEEENGEVTDEQIKKKENRILYVNNEKQPDFIKGSMRDYQIFGNFKN